MQLLLDTHAFIWAISSPANLSAGARNAIEDSENDIYISAAVAWEIVIKYARGKLVLPVPPAIFMSSTREPTGFRELTITQDHALATAALPAIHADPFDRIMIAQAQYESMTFVTRDARSLRYAVPSIEA